MSNLFWERFYNACISKGTKPNPVAKEIDISSGIVTKWKTTGTLPNGESLIKISNHLGLSVDYLLGLSDDPEGLNLTKAEKELLEKIRKLDDEQVPLLFEKLEDVLNNRNEKK